VIIPLTKINIHTIDFKPHAVSKEAFDKTTPVNPPIVNKDIKPNVNNKGVLYLKLPPYKVARVQPFTFSGTAWPIFSV
jgi:hypothetical protein